MTSNSLTANQQLEQASDLANKRGCMIQWAIYILREHLKHGDQPLNKVDIARQAVLNVTGILVR